EERVRLHALRPDARRADRGAVGDQLQHHRPGGGGRRPAAGQRALQRDRVDERQPDRHGPGEQLRRVHGVEQQVHGEPGWRGGHPRCRRPGRAEGQRQEPVPPGAQQGPGCRERLLVRPVPRRCRAPAREPGRVADPPRAVHGHHAAGHGHVDQRLGRVALRRREPHVEGHPRRPAGRLVRARGGRRGQVRWQRHLQRLHGDRLGAAAGRLRRQAVRQHHLEPPRARRPCLRRSVDVRGHRHRHRLQLHRGLRHDHAAGRLGPLRGRRPDGADDLQRRCRGRRRGQRPVPLATTAGADHRERRAEPDRVVRPQRDLALLQRRDHRPVAGLQRM
ncbi:MAG: hypothetical protein AVDCRST_MAG35-2400, partial [uncultured Quadrisphaera sp.]